MNQTLITILRPSLNLAQPFNQQAHLIEHLLMDPARLLAGGITDERYSRTIVSMNAYTSEIGTVEYYAVRAEYHDELVAVLSSFMHQLSARPSYFETERSALIQELAEQRDVHISQNEQFCRSIFTADSPVNRHPWHQPTTIEGCTLEELEQVFASYGKPFLVTATRDRLEGDHSLRWPTNQLLPQTSVVRLEHPDQPLDSVALTYIIPLPPSTLVRGPELELIRCALTHLRFGALFHRLREELGLVYDCDVSLVLSDGYLDIVASTAPAHIEQVTHEIEAVLMSLESHIRAQFEHLVRRVALWHEGDWFDPAESWNTHLSSALYLGDWRSHTDRLQELSQLEVDRVIDVLHEVIAGWKERIIRVEQWYGEEVR